MEDKLNGVWNLKSSDKFDEYMKALEVNMALRKMGNMLKPKVTIVIKGNSFNLKSESSMLSFEISCVIGEEFDEETPDGRKTKTTIVWKGDKLVQTQKWDGKVTTITRYVDEKGDLIVDCAMEDVASRRIYSKA